MSFPKSVDKNLIIERVNEIKQLLKNHPDSNDNDFESKFEKLFYGNEEPKSPSIKKLVSDSIQQRRDKKYKFDVKRLDKHTNESPSKFKTIEILLDLQNALTVFINKKSKVSENLIFNEALNEIKNISLDYRKKMREFYDKKNEPSPSNLISQSINSLPSEDRGSSEVNLVPKKNESLSFRDSVSSYSLGSECCD